MDRHGCQARTTAGEVNETTLPSVALSFLFYFMIMIKLSASGLVKIGCCWFNSLEDETTVQTFCDVR